MFFPLFGFSINTLSLFGLVLAIGLVVDDAIVCGGSGRTSHRGGPHNRKRRLSKRWKKFPARWWVSRSFFRRFFIPTAFIPGITGRLYQQFAVTIAISVILSAFNALTLSPALAALLLRPRNRERRISKTTFWMV